MTRESKLLTILHRSNPIPELETLVDSDAARELASKRPGSVIDWQARDDEYFGDGYRIRLLEPRKWQITHRDRLLAYHQSQKAAFSMVERHRREALRRQDLLLYSGIFAVAAVVAAAMVPFIGRGNAFPVLILGVLVFAAISALIRFTAVLSRSVTDPYRRTLPWERGSRWRRLLRR